MQCKAITEFCLALSGWSQVWGKEYSITATVPRRDWNKKHGFKRLGLLLRVYETFRDPFRLANVHLEYSTLTWNMCVGVRRWDVMCISKDHADATINRFQRFYNSYRSYDLTTRFRKWVCLPQLTEKQKRNLLDIGIRYYIAAEANSGARFDETLSKKELKDVERKEDAQCHLWFHFVWNKAQISQGFQQIHLIHIRFNG